MKKFIVIYHSSPEEMAQMATATPEQKAESMKPWMEWQQRIGSSLVDMGAPLMGGVKVNADGSTQPSTKEVSGYSIIQAENMEKARGLLAGHPHNKIELHETISM